MPNTSRATQINPTQQELITETTKLVHELTDLIRKLNSDNLQSPILKAIQHKSQRLLEIAETHRTADIRQIHAWRRKCSNSIQHLPNLLSYLNILEKESKTWSTPLRDIDSFISLLQRFHDTEQNHNQTNKQYLEAIEANEYKTVQTLSAQMQSGSDEISAIKAKLKNLTDTSAIPTSTTPPSEQSSSDTTTNCDDTKKTANLNNSPSAELGQQTATLTVTPTTISPKPAPVATNHEKPNMPDDKPTNELVQSELGNRNLPIAYHISLHDDQLIPNSNAIKLIASNYVTRYDPDLTDQLPEIINRLDADMTTWLSSTTGLPRSKQNELATLLATASLTPARLSPGRPVSQILERLSQHLTSLPGLRELTLAAARVSLKGIILPTRIISQDGTIDHWAFSADSLRRETQQWLTSNRDAKIGYPHAAKVWHAMLQTQDIVDRKSLGAIFKDLCDTPYEDININVYLEITNEWTKRPNDIIDRIDRHLRRGSSFHKIDGSARKRLISKLKEATDYLNRWIQLLRARPAAQRKSDLDLASSLRRSVREHASSALRDLTESHTPLTPLARGLLQAYIDSFSHPQPTHCPLELDLIDILNARLLLNPSILFSSDRVPDDCPIPVSALTSIPPLTDSTALMNAAAVRSEQYDFVGARLIVDYAQRTSCLDDDSMSKCRATLDRCEVDLQNKCSSRLSHVVNRIDSSYARGIITFEAKESLRCELPNNEGSLLSLRILADIEQKIDDKQATRQRHLRSYLNELSKISPAAKKRITDLIDRGRFHIAEDFLERIELDRPLPAEPSPSSNAFEIFCPDFITHYDQLISRGKRSLEDVVEEVQANDFFSRYPNRFSIDLDHRIPLLNAWRSLPRQQERRESIELLLNSLGLRNPKAQPPAQLDESRPGLSAYYVTAVPIRDLIVTPIPDFGSGSKGRYKVFIVDSRRTIEGMLRDLSESIRPGDPPIIVLFTRPLNLVARQSLAKTLRTRRHHPLIVIDEIMIIFLAFWASDRLNALFDCALPFAYVQPYNPDAVQVPVEMFVGREIARERILSMSKNVAHFVYGGRRLGKTALLENVALEHSLYAPECIVQLINLQGMGFEPMHHQTDAIWRYFAERLSQFKVIGSTVKAYGTIVKQVQQWIDSDDSGRRRILLLIDEADDFLDADRNGKYRVLSQIVELMNRTHLRFKVVFAGLHNVQRAAKDPNTPLARLGPAIRIGPLLPDSDPDAIEDLIRTPIHALGYRFESPDSVIRIAAETNYYPALVQQVCKDLVTEMCNRQHLDRRDGPPYVISQSIIDRLFDSRQTRDRIRELFSWTVHLDPRYEFLTYLIGQLSFSRDAVRPQPVSIGDIKEQALYDWPVGFKSDSSNWMFEVLLDEMVGLGVLREVAANEFAIRTYNLRMLLGNDDEIERRYEDAKRKRPPSTCDPIQFRRKLRRGMPSSFTLNQERELRRSGKVVSIVFGTNMAGLSRVGDSLNELKIADPQLFLHEIEAEQMFKTLRELTKRDGLTVVLIDMQDKWNPAYIEHALTQVRSSRSARRIVRPVFLCGPKGAKEWVIRKGLSPKINSGVRSICLRQCSFDFARETLAKAESSLHRVFDVVDPKCDPPWPEFFSIESRHEAATSLDAAMQQLVEKRDLVSDVLFDPVDSRVLRLLTVPDDREYFDADELSEVSSEYGSELRFDPEEALACFRWCDFLGITHTNGNGYRLDDAYRMGIKRWATVTD